MRKGEELRERTKKFASRIIGLVSSLPKTREADVLGKQLLRAGTSVGANYREATRARSKAEFRSKIGIVEQEADETLYWLELIEGAEIIRKDLSVYFPHSAFPIPNSEFRIQQGERNDCVG